MSSLTTETKEVWVVYRHDICNDYCWEIDECRTEEEAVILAQEEIARYISGTGERCWCTIEHQVVPIYK